MDQGVGTTLVVSLGTAPELKAHVFIKTCRLIILFIDIGGKVRLKVQCMLNKSSSNSGSPIIRINEQRLHMAAL